MAIETELKKLVQAIENLTEAVKGNSVSVPVVAPAGEPITPAPGVAPGAPPTGPTTPAPGVAPTVSTPASDNVVPLLTEVTPEEMQKIMGDKTIELGDNGVKCREVMAKYGVTHIGQMTPELRVTVANEVRGLSK